ncbi:two-component sensor histidine kinase [Pseudoalteromonas sp. C2R02]|uniref:ATP-binding protein n=1 Tax=Pseudoalteromonas sp. C2R02 TaxID=2841565 RepID=UPI001C0A303A|nr:ATP-binding protein [Pseudoalteromonas sp. C2R02]MBU2972368.1 two-component sensor histidine kinase [Pseudoalteromonas sp. C2R02]
MKKLILSLILIVIFSIIGLGWGLDNLFAQYQTKNEIDELKPYKQITTALAQTLDEQSDIQAFVSQWQKTNDLKISLINLEAFPLPQPLQHSFKSGKPLTLESDNDILIHVVLPKHQHVLVLTLPQLINEHDNSQLQLIFTSIFYITLLLILFIWLYPLIKHLRQLGITAKAFGEGKLEQRITIDKTSYIAGIETEFNKMAQRIETLISDNQLLGNAVSHDLRTPLARLRFGIEALEETNNPKLREKYQKHISRDVDEMEKLVAVLLNYARLDQAMVAIDKRKVVIQDVISDCINTINPKHIEIEFIPNKNLTLLADINYLSMLINNLLSNAIQYASTKIVVKVIQNDNIISLIVADDGQGIEQSKRQEILKPFTRGDNAIDKQGYGMGLAIVTRIAQWHEANLKISQCINLGGAEFSIIFKG